MSTGDQTCQYVFEPTTPTEKKLLEAAGITDQDAWHCPHLAEEDSELCCFHLPVDEKDDEAVSEEILNRIHAVSAGDSDDLPSETLQFVGATLGTLSFGDDVDTIDIDDRNLTFFGATIDRIMWNDLTVSAGTVDFQHTSFTGAARFKNTTFDCSTEFRGAVFERNTNFYNTVFREDLTFIGVTVRGGANFKKAEFAGEHNFFTASVFETTANFARMEGLAHFDDVSFEGGANFAKAHLTGIFDSAIFDESAYFKQATIPHASFEHVTFNDEANFYGVEFEAAVQFDHATFEDGGYFKEVAHDHLSFPYADVSGSRFDDAEIPYANFNHADLTDTVFEGADLRGANLVSAVMTRGMLFDANLPGAFLSGTIFRDVQINEHTRFLGHHTDSGESQPQRSAADSSTQWCVYDPEYQPDNDHEDRNEARRVYKKLELLARRNARVQLETRCTDRRHALRTDTDERG